MVLVIFGIISISILAYIQCLYLIFEEDKKK